jgi:hypothetical protein
VLFLAALPACSSMTRSESPADWPALEVIERQVSVIDVQKKCFKYLTPAGLALSFGLTMGYASSMSASIAPARTTPATRPCAAHGSATAARCGSSRPSASRPRTTRTRHETAGLTIPDPGFTILDLHPLAPAPRAAYDQGVVEKGKPAERQGRKVSGLKGARAPR